jgi:hypothetical protein
MQLSRLEIQQMLREMNVKFSADETFEALKQRLQQENHARWLKSVAGGREDEKKLGRQVVRKRKKAKPPQASTPDIQETPSEPRKRRSKQSSAEQPKAPVFRRHPIDKPAPGKPWKEAADGIEPFNRKKKVFESVLRRSRMCCEGCGNLADEDSGQPDLTPFHIQPLDQGGEHSVKNVVALCPTCLETIQTDPDLKIIKELKRRARAKLYDSLEVVRKKKGRGRKV